MCGDLLRILANDEVPLTLPALMQVQTSNPSNSSNTQISSVASVAMEVEHPQLPSQAAKPKKISKPESKKPTSVVFQKAPVVTPTTSQPDGSVKEVSGKGKGEHQKSPQNKEGEVSENQPSHPTSSQKDVVINMETNTSLVASSQKDVTIENSSPPRAQNKRARDTDQTPPKTFARKNKRRALEARTTVQSKTTDFVAVQSSLSQSQFNVTPANVKSQPPQIETLPQISDFQMEEFDLLYNFPHPNSPTLNLEKPTSKIDDHLFIDLLGH